MRRYKLLIAAAVCAVFFALIVRSIVGGEEEATPANKVLVAAGNIAAGSFVRMDRDFMWVDWPESNLQPGFFTQGNTHPESLNGAVARRAIAANEPITATMVVKPNEGGFLPAVLEPGTRAVSIAVNSISGNAGFVFPGDRVDLILTHRIRTSRGNGDEGGEQSMLASETFLENIRVVAVDQMLANPENKAVLAKTLTLEVSPKQAETINVATDLGKISVSLRSLASSTDPETSKKIQETGEKLLQGYYGSATAGESITRDSDVSRLLNHSGGINAKVNVIRGNETEQLEFNQGN